VSVIRSLVRCRRRRGLNSPFVVLIGDMKSWDLAFTGGWPLWLILCLAAGAALLSHLCYRKKKGALSPRSLLVLSALRMLLILIVALFILKPVVRFVRTEMEQAQVVVLLDVSKSMSIQDAAEGKSRLDAGRLLLSGRDYRILDRLAETQRVRLFSFGAVTSELGDFEQLKDLQADQEATAIGKALKESTDQLGREGLSGVVLLTDGVSTLGQPPLDVARFLGVPVFPVALGGKMAERGKFHDIGIAGTPHHLEFIVNNRASIKTTLSSFGLEKLTESEREVPLTLSEEDQTLATAEVQFQSTSGTQDFQISYVPKETGVHKLVLSLPVLPGETVTENNTRTFTVKVTDPKIKVLIVEGVVRTEYRFLRRTLESDPNVELSCVIKLRADRFLLQGNDPGIDLSRGLPARKEDFEKFDVIVLGDIGREEFTDVQLEYLKEFVADGGSLLAMGGYHSFGAGGYAGSPLEDVLPVVMGGKLDGHVEKPFALQLTAAGRSHPVFEGCERFFSDPASPFMLEGANRVKGLKPGADLLAGNPQEKAEGQSMPVVAVQRYGSGKVEALTADTTWKWKFQVEARGMDSPYYRFWRQSVRWLAGRKEEELEGEELVSAWTHKVEYESAEPVLISAKVRNRQKEPEDNARVEVQIHYPIPVSRKDQRGQTYTEKEAQLTLNRIPLGLGEYQASFRPPVEGIYRATARAYLEGDQLGEAEFDFVVGRATSEFDRVDVNELELRAIAGETGGRFHSLVTASKIPEELERRRRKITYREEKNLWNAPAFFLVFLGCVTLEWILRKKRALN